MRPYGHYYCSAYELSDVQVSDTSCASLCVRRIKLFVYIHVMTTLRINCSGLYVVQIRLFIGFKFDVRGQSWSPRGPRACFFPRPFRETMQIIGPRRIGVQYCRKQSMADVSPEALGNHSFLLRSSPDVFVQLVFDRLSRSPHVTILVYNACHRTFNVLTTGDCTSCEKSFSTIIRQLTLRLNTYNVTFHSGKILLSATLLVSLITELV